MSPDAEQNKASEVARAVGEHSANYHRVNYCFRGTGASAEAHEVATGWWRLQCLWVPSPSAPFYSTNLKQMLEKLLLPQLQPEEPLRPFLILRQKNKPQMMQNSLPFLGSPAGLVRNHICLHLPAGTVSSRFCDTSVA